MTFKELILQSKNCISKCLGINLPKDLPKKNKEMYSFVQNLKNKLIEIPTCIFYDIYHAVHNINMKTEIKDFVNLFYPLLDEIKNERQKTSYDVETIELKNSAEKISELRAPNNTLIEILKIDSKFFVSRVQFSKALGYRDGCWYHSTLGNAIKVKSNFYSIAENSKYEDYVLVKDISSITKEYAFYRADEIFMYEYAKEFLEWWEKVSIPYIETQQEEKKDESKKSLNDEDIKSIGKIADSIMEVMGTTRENAIKAAIKIKSKELDIDLTSLLDLLK